MDPKIGISKANLAKSSAVLNVLLADEFLLYTKTRNAHWNVEGPDFHAMHKFFEAQYEQLDEIMDEVAERTRSLGQSAPGTLKRFLEITHLKEQLKGKADSTSFIKELLADHESIINYIRENVKYLDDELNDAGTADFVTGIMETHEKMAWMLRSHLR